MAKCYFELRKQSARGTDSIAADMMRHLHTRQNLGKAVVVGHLPIALHAAARKQWLRLGRSIQKQRASTLNADKILKYTHTITRMQHMRFTHKTPLQEPEADVYFLDQAGCQAMPQRCLSVYLAQALDTEAARALLHQLPADALMIDYDHGTTWGCLGLQSKLVLEEQVESDWQQMQQFLQSHHIAFEMLWDGTQPSIEAMDYALDALLDVSAQFLNIAEAFQHALAIARPLRINHHRRQAFDAVLLLAYRVQALSPGLLTYHFLDSYNEDDTFFLCDSGRQHARQYQIESLAAAIASHVTAGRLRLARALQAQVTKHQQSMT